MMTESSWSPISSISTYSDSEFGKLTDVLLCRPQYTWGGRTSESDLVQAVKQHASLVNVLEDHDIRCHFIPEDSVLPYQCFTRDSLVVTPWGLIPTRFAHVERWPEQDITMAWCRENNLGMWASSDGEFLEGGDVILVKPGLVFIGVNDVRTTSMAAYVLGGKFVAQGWQVKIFRYPARYVHLDSILGVLDGSNVVCCAGALEVEDIDWLQLEGFSVHELPLESAKQGSVNFLNLGDKKILSSSNDPHLEFITDALGYELITIELSQFLKKGGGAHALVQPLRRMSLDKEPRLRLIPGGR